MSENIVPQQTTQSQAPQVQQLSLVVEDGFHYNPAINEYEIWLGGQIINYATFEYTAIFMLNEARANRRIHGQKCPTDLALGVAR